MYQVTNKSKYSWERGRRERARKDLILKHEIDGIGIPYKHRLIHLEMRTWPVARSLAVGKGARDLLMDCRLEDPLACQAS